MFYARNKSKKDEHFKVDVIVVTSTPIGAWKCYFPAFFEIMTDHPTDEHEGSFKNI